MTARGDDGCGTHARYLASRARQAPGVPRCRRSPGRVLGDIAYRLALWISS